MIQTAQLKGIIAARGLSQRKVAKYLGITEKTFYDKMKKGVFKSDEMEGMIELLSITEPGELFFAKSEKQ